MIFDVLSTLSDLTEYLSEKYLKAVSSNPLYLILHNQSFEEGERLRGILRPQTMELRYKLRGLYREPHSEDYEDALKFEDNFRKYCDENGYDYKLYTEG